MKSFLLQSAAATRIISQNLAQFRDIDGALESETVASDLTSLAKYWGIDMKTTWLDQDDETKKTLWAYLTHIDDHLHDVTETLGVDEDKPPMYQQLEDNTAAVIDSVETAKKGIQGNMGYTLDHVVFFNTKAEKKSLDVMQELVERVRFISDRVVTIEMALGLGYISDIGGDTGGYAAHICETFPIDSVVPAEPEAETPPESHETTQTTETTA